MVCIIDDREDVWKMAPNLVHVQPYRFFDGTADINAPPEASKTDVDDASTEGVCTKPVRHNIRIVRVPRKPRDDSCEKSVTDFAASAASENVLLDNNTSLKEAEPDATVTTCEGSGDCNGRATENTTLPCSDGASNEAVAETSAADNSTSDSVIVCNASDQTVEHHLDDAEKTASAADSETPAPTSASGDGLTRQPANTTVDSTIQEDEEYEELVEWEDLDDYLIYLEDILRRIHTAYYELYDEMQRTDDSQSVDAAPDLKTIVPYVRRKVLKGARIVFSGVCPLDTDPTTCRIYRVAESLGAVVQSSMVTNESTNSVSEATTHVVAARPGTEKVKAALRQRSVSIVNPSWLWTCADRWEWVDERLYPLNDETSGPFLSRDSPDPTANPRKKDATCNGKRTGLATSKVAENNGSNIGLYSLVTLSKEDISGMDAEVEKILDEDSESEYEDGEVEASGGGVTENQLDGNEGDTALRKQVLSSFCGSKRKYEESSDEESLSGDFPKGWKHFSRKRRRVSNDGSKVVRAQENNGDNDDFDDDCDVRSDDSQEDNVSESGSEDEDFNESVGSIDEEIAAAVEKEFLS